MRSKFKRFRISPAFPISLLALFLALGGLAVAKATIGTKDIKKGAVTSAKIKNGTIQQKDLGFTLAPGAVGPAGAPGAQGPAGGGGATGPAGPAGAGGPGQAFGLDLRNNQQTVAAGNWSVRFGEAEGDNGACENPRIFNTGTEAGVVWVTNLSGGAVDAAPPNNGVDPTIVAPPTWTNAQPLDSGGHSTSLNDVLGTGATGLAQFSSLKNQKYEIDAISPVGVMELTFIQFANENHCVVVGSNIHIP